MCWKHYFLITEQLIAVHTQWLCGVAWPSLTSYIWNITWVFSHVSLGEQFFFLYKHCRNKVYQGDAHVSLLNTRKHCGKMLRGELGQRVLYGQCEPITQWAASPGTNSPHTGEQQTQAGWPSHCDSTQPLPSVWVSWSCHNKVPQTGWL